MEYTTCSACGLANIASASQCFRCGTQLTRVTSPGQKVETRQSDYATAVMDRPAGGVACASCGYLNDASMKICTNCGRARTAVSVTAETAPFYQGRLVPDSAFRRDQQAAMVPGVGSSVGTTKSTSVVVFTVFNIVFGLLSVMWSLLWTMGLAGELVGGGGNAFGHMIWLVWSIVNVLVFVPAAIGMIKRSMWGYYFHLAGAVLAALTCIGLAYAIPAFIISLKPDFRSEFK